MADEDEVVSANNNEEVFVYMGGNMVVSDCSSCSSSSIRNCDSRQYSLYSVQCISRSSKFGCHWFVWWIDSDREWCIHILLLIEACKHPIHCQNNWWLCFWWGIINIKSLQTLYLYLTDSNIESIGTYAFCHGRFPTVRIPPRVTTIREWVFYNCSSMFSAELSETITQVVAGELGNRGVAVSYQSPQAVAFKDCTDLLQLFGSQAQIINALKHRFDNLPIHRMIYYHLNNNITPAQLSVVQLTWGLDTQRDPQVVAN